jgi:hypothetical protein
MLKVSLVLAGAVAGLAYAGSALAAFTPTLAVTQGLTATGAKPTTIHLNVPQTDDPTAVVQIYVPTGYALAAPVAGSTIGSASGQIFARDAGLTLPLEGNVVADDPANHAADPCSPGGHLAVWLMNLSVAGNTISIPIYVDQTVGPEANFGAYRIRTCFGPPDVPANTPGRSPLGAQLLDAKFTIENALTNPTTAGRYVWRSLLTPWTPGAGVPNQTGTVEARSFLSLPGTLSLQATYLKKTNTYRLTGAASGGGTAVAGGTVQIYRGAGLNVKRVSATRTNSSGTYATAGRLKPKKTTYFQTRITVAEAPYAVGCSATGLAPAPVPCATATLGGWSAASRIIRIKL